MPELIYDSSGENAWWIFVLVTVILGGGAAYLSGKAIAQTWRPYWHVPLYMVPLAATVRFFHFALFQEPLVSLKSFAVDFLVALIAASFGLGSAAGTHAQPGPVARTRWGRVRGAQAGRVLVFKGVRYGAPTERFRPPRPRWGLSRAPVHRRPARRAPGRPWRWFCPPRPAPTPTPHGSHREPFGPPGRLVPR